MKTVGLAVLGMAAVVAGVATVYTPEVVLPKKKTAVILANPDMKATHSKFLEDLKKTVDVELLNGADKLVLKQYEEFNYDNVVVLGSPAKFGGDLLDFVDSGHNILVVASSEGKTAEEHLNDDLRTIAVECGVEFTMNPVKDNFAENPSILKADRFVKASPIVGDEKLKAVVYKGLGMRVESDNPLATHILTAGRTAYVSDPEILGKMYGNDIALVAGLQSRIGSRAVFSGSTDMFSNSHWDTNSVFVKKVWRWAFQMKGILRYSNVDAVRLVDGKESRDGEMFRIKEHIRFSVTVEEYDGEKDAWVPFVTPKDDPIQVEYIMIDPYVRADLKQVGSVHTVDLQAPDKYGIFKFVVDYRRTGYNNLIFHHQAPVRPLKLNEYERFITAAYPYYLGTFSAMAGYCLLGFVFLYSRE